MSLEVNFPRGGSSKSTAKNFLKKRLRNAENSPVDSKKSKLDAFESKLKEGPEDYTDVFRRTISTDLLSPDVRGLGFIKKIDDTFLTLESAEGILIKVHSDRISKKFIEYLAKKRIDATLEEIFHFGQALAFKVQEIPAAKAQKWTPSVLASTCPYELNHHLLPSDLFVGLALNGTILSIEEKGAIIDMGLANCNVTGFVHPNDLPDYLSLDRLHLGQVVLFRVKAKPTESSRVVQLSAFVEAELAKETTVHLNQLMPGTIVQVDPEKAVFDGIYVRILNGPKAFIRKIHLPPRIRYDIAKFVKPIRVCVLYCQQNSPLLVLSGHPDIIAVSQVHRRIFPQNFKIGDKIQCYVYAIDKQHNVYFRMDAPNEHDPRDLQLITAKALRINIDDVENKITQFGVNSLHTCRIIGYNLVERQFLVTTKSDHVHKNLPLSLEELRPGQKVKAVIDASLAGGLTVRIGDILGFVTQSQLMDGPCKQSWKKDYTKGQSLTCRVLFLDLSRNRVVLTSKPSIVKMASGRKVVDYSEDLTGATTFGTVLRLLDSGGLVIGFFNRTTGLMHATDAKPILNNGSVKVGSVVQVKIRSVDPSIAQIIVEPINNLQIRITDDNMDNCSQTSVNPRASKTKKPIATKSAKPFNIYTAKVLGPWLYGGTSQYTTAELLLPGGTIGRLHASELQAKLLTEGLCPMTEFLLKNSGKMVNVKVISIGRPKFMPTEGRELLNKNHQTERIAECTMRADKIENSRRKLRLINYTIEYSYAERVPVFLLPLKHIASHDLPGELNPNFKANIILQCHNDKMSLNNDSSAENDTQQCSSNSLIIDDKPAYHSEVFGNGELQYASVTGVNKAKRSRVVMLTLVQTPEFTRKKRSNKQAISQSSDNAIKTEEDSMRNASESCPENSLIDKCPTQELVRDLKDPGFDWTLKGYQLTDLLNVAKRPDSDMLEDHYLEADCSPAMQHDTDMIKALESIGLEPMETGEAYDQQLARNPNSSKLWISYIAFFLGQKAWSSKKRYENSKVIAERAIKAIDSREEIEHLNLWTAYLNLEMMLGTEDSLKAVFQRACAATDSFKMHKILLKSYQNHQKALEKHQDICDLFEVMLKKFRQRADLEVWFMYSRYLMEKGDLSKARQLMQRALQHAQNKKHLKIIKHFVQLEEKYGDSERASTMAQLVQSYSNKKNSASDER